MEAELLTNGFRNVCPNVSIIRDEPEAQYMIFASGACPGFYAITTSQSMTSRGKWCLQPTNIPAKMLSAHSVDSSILKSSPLWQLAPLLMSILRHAEGT
jgi:hypothetical protein